MTDRDVAALRPAERFSDRVENYVKYRPGYPREVLELMRREMNLTPDSVIADIGSGPGMLSRLFVENGNPVYGIEPNREMREAGEHLFDDVPNFGSVAGAAEATTLPDASVDFVTAGQAFHWFDIPRARAEFKRILRPGGWAVLVWNDRRRDSTVFQRAYENLLREWGTDYMQLVVTSAPSEEASEAVLCEFFGGDYRNATFDNYQAFDFEGMRGRLLSASYVPLKGQPGHAELFKGMREVFDAHQENGQIKIEYDTQVYYGHIE